MRVDLHIHTTASDSRWTVDQVVEGVKAAGIGLFAVADHDTVASVDRAESLARLAGLAFLPCVEFSATLDGRLIHILSYGIDRTDHALGELLAANRAAMKASNTMIIRRMIEYGFPIDWDDYVAYRHVPTRGGFRELNFAIDRGICSSVDGFYSDVLPLLNLRAPELVTVTDAIAVVRAAGGVPVLAHPGASLRDVGVSESTLAPLLEAGVGGLECHSQYHDRATTDFCVAYCRDRGLLITGGSDYHGGFVNRQLGVPIVSLDELYLGELMQLVSCHGA
ncbi:MAG: PHP domain-containing protein [Chloroflexi bacterium]|nr:PHP domain-containing protein [Chloroflexota bacterium]